MAPILLRFYAHAEFRRANPFDGWGPHVEVNTPEANIVNKGRDAWDKKYVILETKGLGHYIGCDISVTNITGSWWGEGDDMIWVDGCKWPPDLHDTGSETILTKPRKCKIMHIRVMARQSLSTTRRAIRQVMSIT